MSGREYEGPTQEIQAQPRETLKTSDTSEQEEPDSTATTPLVEVENDGLQAEHTTL